MIIKNNNGKRIKSCDKCQFVGVDILGQPYCKSLDLDISLNFTIPIECKLPNWKRTINVVV